MYRHRESSISLVTIHECQLNLNEVDKFDDMALNCISIKASLDIAIVLSHFRRILLQQSLQFPGKSGSEVMELLLSVKMRLEQTVLFCLHLSFLAAILADMTEAAKARGRSAA